MQQIFINLDVNNQFKKFVLIYNWIINNVNMHLHFYLEQKFPNLVFHVQLLFITKNELLKIEQFQYIYILYKNDEAVQNVLTI